MKPSSIQMINKPALSKCQCQFCNLSSIISHFTVHFTKLALAVSHSCYAAYYYKTNHINTDISLTLMCLQCDAWNNIIIIPESCTFCSTTIFCSHVMKNHAAAQPCQNLLAASNFAAFSQFLAAYFVLVFTMSPLEGKGTWHLLPTAPDMRPTATKHFERGGCSGSSLNISSFFLLRKLYLFSVTTYLLEGHYSLLSRFVNKVNAQMRNVPFFKICGENWSDF